MKAPTACFPLAAAAIRRWGSAIMLVSYFWVTGVFPVAHAAAEAPQAGVVAESGGGPPPDQLPVGHDHLTCHFCATGGTLAASPSDHPAPVPGFHAPTVSPAPLNLPSMTLTWTHHAIPSRAPPAQGN